MFTRVPQVVVPLPSTIYPFTSDGVARWCAQEFVRRRMTHERLFKQYTELYGISEGTEVALGQRLRGATAGRAGNLIEAIRITEQRRVEVELAAEALAMSLDSVLTSLRFRLFGKDVCCDHGPQLRNGVTVDRALDAIGNYVRHGWEWFSHDYGSTWPSKQQTRSIAPLAQLHTTRPIGDSEDAYQEFTLITMPATFVVDLLGDYATLGPKMTFAVIEHKVSLAAMSSIEARLGPRFPQ